MKNSVNTKFVKPSCLLIDGYNNLTNSFDKISQMMSKYNEFLLSSQTSIDNSINNIKIFSVILKDFIDLKDNFKQIFKTKFEKSSLISNCDPSTNSSDETSHNSYYNNKNTKIKSSYDKIFNEFQKIEKNTKELNYIKKEYDEKKKKRIKMLELKLQGFCDEVKNVNFDYIQKQLEDLALNGSLNVNKLNNLENVHKSSNLIIANDNLRLRVSDNDKVINSEVIDNKNQNSKNIPLINQILNLNSTKGDDMIKFIESLLVKSSSENEMNDTIKFYKKV